MSEESVPTIPLVSGVNGVAPLFWALSKFDPRAVIKFVTNLSHGEMERLGRWSEAFSKTVNDLGPKWVEEGVADSVLAEKGIDTDFFELMRNSEYKGPKLAFGQIQEAHNDITRAIKANNWKEAIYTAVTLAGSFATPA